jgi:general secretion pathway protein D
LPSDTAAVAAPLLLPGTGNVVRPQSSPSPVVAAEGAGDIRMNFVDTDVRELVHAVLDDLLHLNYAIDAKLQAALTIQTSGPLRRDEVLPAFEEALRAGGLALVEAAGVYRIVPLDDAAPAIVVGQGDLQSPPARARLTATISRTISTPAAPLSTYLPR